MAAAAVAVVLCLCATAANFVAGKKHGFVDFGGADGATEDFVTRVAEQMDGRCDIWRGFICTVRSGPTECVANNVPCQ